jgi:hypothetical protein
MSAQSVSDARAYVLLGGRRLAAISERVRQALDSVAREWFGKDSRLQLIEVNALESVPRICMSRLRYIARDDAAWIAFITPDGASAKLAETWFGCDVPAPGPLIESLERELYLALFGQLRGTGEPAVIVAATSGQELLEGANARAGAGTAVIEIDIEGVPLTLVVPADVWPELLDVTVDPSRRVLTQVATALTNHRVRIEARLPAVQMHLSDVSALAAGDFVDLQLDLTGAVRIVGQHFDVGPGLEAVLGKRDGRRAIQFNHPTGTTTQ